MQIQETQTGMASTSLTIGTLEVARVLCMKDSRAIVLPDEALVTETKADRPSLSALKGVGLNLALLPSEALHVLQNGVITELRAYE